MLRHEDRDDGAVTVEAAVGIGSLVTVLALALAAMAMVIGQLRCTDAAVEAARLIARGERHRASEVITKVAPQGARLEVIVQGDLLTTKVTAPAAGGFLLGKVLESRAHAVLEPGVSGQAAS